MGMFGDDFGIDLNGHHLTIRNAIVGYKKSEYYPLPLVLVLPCLAFNKKSDDEGNDFEDAGMALYPKSEYFNYDKGTYLASLISLNNEISGTLVFIHAERIDNSECRDDWENLLKNLMTHSPIRISDELTITRPETDFTVIVCTEKPHFLKEGTSIKYHCIDLSDNNPEKERKNYKDEYDVYVENGRNEMEKKKKTSVENAGLVERAGSIATEKTTGENGSFNGKHIDWEERRYEILRTIINGRLIRTGNSAFSFDNASLNKMIGEANKVIKRLKERLNDEVISCSE